MAFKCLDCGHVFGYGECSSFKEPHGETTCWCPICGGSFEETKECKICGGEFLEEELNGDCVCDECIEEYSKDFDTCYAIANRDKQEISINGLLATVFDASEIEQILFEFLKKDGNEIDCSEYIEQDKHWFAEALVNLKEVKK